MPQVTVDLYDDLYRMLQELVASKPGRTPEDTLLELLISPLHDEHFFAQNPAQNFRVTLTDEQAAQARELAAYWRVTLDEALRLAAVDGLDVAIQIKAHDEREAAGLPDPHAPPSGTKLDDDLPF